MCGNIQRGKHLNLSLKGEVLEVVDAFKYMETIVGKNGGIKGDVLNKALL